VGLNRVYASVPQGAINVNTWLDSLKHGRTFVTNGPLLGFTLGGRQVGDDLRLPAGENKVKFSAWLRSLVPVDHLQVVCNGQVASELKLNAARDGANVDDTVTVAKSGWCVLRAWSEKAEYPVLDAYPYATTSPIYVTVDGSAIKAGTDATYFITWIDRLIEEVKSNHDWNTEAEKTATLNLLSYARNIYVQIQK